MSVEETNTIDFTSIDKSTGNVVLTISDHLDWSDPFSHLFKLQAKLNSYLYFYESGEMLESYPAAKGRRVAIEVVMKYDLGVCAEAVTFMEKAKGVIEGAGIVSFTWRGLRVD